MTTPQEHVDFAARQSVTDALRLTAKLAASYLTEAADTIENLREQLAEAERELVAKEAERAAIDAAKGESNGKA